jgi:hypothetical protein
VIVTVASERGRCVRTEKVALVAPSATVTEDGTVARDGLLLESDTAAPPEGAVALKVTVPVEPLPPRTLVGLSVSDAREAEASPPPQTLGVPPPPQICGQAHVPQLSVAPQPSGMLPQFFPCAAHVLGVQAPEGTTFSVAVWVTPAPVTEIVTVLGALTTNVWT